MATWLTHMRIARHILAHEPSLSPPLFLAGSIGPDCSRPVSGGKGFDPPKTRTHFMGPGYRIDPACFLDTCLAPEEPDSQRDSFLLGFYAHLAADRLWDEFIRKDKRNHALYAGPDKDPVEIARIKEEWDAQDRLYLRETQNNIFTAVFCRIKSVPDYLDFYPPGQVSEKIREIICFYTERGIAPGRKFRFLETDALNEFVRSSADTLIRRDPGFRTALRRLADCRKMQGRTQPQAPGHPAAGRTP